MDKQKRQKRIEEGVQVNKRAEIQTKRTKNEIEAEDITIESFAKAFKKINTYNNKYVFKTWLITISKNLHIDKVRKDRNKIDINEFTDKISIKEKKDLFQ